MCILEGLPQHKRFIDYVLSGIVWFVTFFSFLLSHLEKIKSSILWPKEQGSRQEQKGLSQQPRRVLAIQLAV